MRNSKPADWGGQEGTGLIDLWRERLYLFLPARRWPSWVRGFLWGSPQGSPQGFLLTVCCTIVASLCPPASIIPAYAATTGPSIVQVTTQQIAGGSAGSELSFTRRLTLIETVPGLQLRLTGPKAEFNVLQHEDRDTAGYVSVSVLSGGGVGPDASVFPGELSFSVPVLSATQDPPRSDGHTATQVPKENTGSLILGAKPDQDTSGSLPSLDTDPLPTERVAPPPLTYTYGRRVLPSRFQETLEFHLDEAMGAGTEIQLRYDVTVPANAGLAEYGLAYRLTSDHEWREQATQNVEVVPGVPSRLMIETTAELSAGKPFSVWLKVVDDYGNLSGDTLPSLQVLMNGRFTRTIEGMTNPGLVPDLMFQTPGQARIEVRSAGGQWRANARPIVRTVPGLGNQTRWVRFQARSNEASSGGTQQNGSSQDEPSASHGETVFLGSPLYAPQDQGGQRLVLTSSRAVSEVLGVEVPADPRQAGSTNILAAIVSPSGVHPWRLEQLADRGHRFGTVGGWQRPDLPGLFRPLTGVSVRPGESLADAIAQGRTWVTTGPRIDLGLSVNGVAPGGRVVFSENRIITGFVQGSDALLDVYLYRNGKPVRRLNTVDVSETVEIPVEDDGKGQAWGQSELADTLLVQFYSDSRPVKPLWDAPRNGREWLGYLTTGTGSIEQARLVGPGGRVGAIEIDDNSVNRVDFITWTRGTTAGLLLGIAGIEEDAEVTVLLGTGREDGTSKVALRPPAQTPGVQFRFRLSGPGSEQRRDIRVDGYTDSIVVRWLRASPDERPTGLTFEVTDYQPRGLGDYYHIVAEQIDGHLAVSSPIWVGGFD